MNKVLRIIGYILAALLALLVVLFLVYYFSRAIPIWRAGAKAGPPADTLVVDGEIFRDLNKNGRLDPYEDRRLPVSERVEDLLSRMTVEEKAGLLYHTFLFPGRDGQVAGAVNPVNILPAQVALFDKHMHFFNLYEIGNAENAARWLNRLQKLAEQTRLGIPITFSSDPRHTAMTEGAAIGIHTEGYSHWTEPIGFAAIRDTALIRRFGEIAAREYRAIGIHTALHPMADLATEPRWGRISGTFGEDAGLASELTAAYIRGFQGDSLTSSSVSTMTKHFPGGGPQKDGWDAHFRYGKDQVYPGGRFDYHLEPFLAAIEAGTAQMMPYYGVPVGQTEEEVAFGFNREILTGLLRDSLGYEGIVCTDWNIINPMRILGFEFMEARDYGVEHLSPEEKTLKALEAGVDQFGGESRPDQVVRLVRDGHLPESRLDASVRRLLEQKFRLGLFENPYVDVERVSERTATEEAVQLGYESQLRSQVLLTNREVDGRSMLPLQEGARIYVEGHDRDIAAEYGTVVDDPEQADALILNLQAPYEPGYGRLAGMEIFREGRLYYTEEELEPVLELLERRPGVVTMYLERPAVIPEIAGEAGAVLANFGASDRAVMDLIFGKATPSGKLPFDMPSDRESVLQQREDVPFDLQDPLFRFGHGLTYGQPDE